MYDRPTFPKDFSQDSLSSLLQPVELYPPDFKSEEGELIPLDLVFDPLEANFDVPGSDQAEGRPGDNRLLPAAPHLGSPITIQYPLPSSSVMLTPDPKLTTPLQPGRTEKKKRQPDQELAENKGKKRRIKSEVSKPTEINEEEIFQRICEDGEISINVKKIREEKSTAELETLIVTHVDEIGKEWEQKYVYSKKMTGTHYLKYCFFNGPADKVFKSGFKIYKKAKRKGKKQSGIKTYLLVEVYGQLYMLRIALYHNQRRIERNNAKKQQLAIEEQQPEMKEQESSFNKILTSPSLFDSIPPIDAPDSHSLKISNEDERLTSLSFFDSISPIDAPDSQSLKISNDQKPSSDNMIRISSLELPTTSEQQAPPLSAEPQLPPLPVLSMNGEQISIPASSSITLADLTLDFDQIGLNQGPSPEPKEETESKNSFYLSSIIYIASLQARLLYLKALEDCCFNIHAIPILGNEELKTAVAQQRSSSSQSSHPYLVFDTIKTIVPPFSIATNRLFKPAPSGGLPVANDSLQQPAGYCSMKPK